MDRWSTKCCQAEVPIDLERRPGTVGDLPSLVLPVNNRHCEDKVLTFVGTVRSVSGRSGTNIQVLCVTVQALWVRCSSSSCENQFGAGVLARHTPWALRHQDGTWGGDSMPVVTHAAGPSMPSIII